MPRTAPATPARGPWSLTGPALTRRALLWGGTAALAGSGLAGCADLSTTVHGTPAATDADTSVVDQAEIALAAALSLLHHTIAAHPSLSGELAPLRALHTAHRDALRSATSTPSPAASTSPATPTTAGAAPVPAGRRAALVAVAGAERALQARLTGLAMDATSGELARLLGAMAAGTAQRLAASAWARESR